MPKGLVPLNYFVVLRVALWFLLLPAPGPAKTSESRIFCRDPYFPMSGGSHQHVGSEAAWIEGWGYFVMGKPCEAQARQRICLTGWGKRLFGTVLGLMALGLRQGETAVIS